VSVLKNEFTEKLVSKHIDMINFEKIKQIAKNIGRK